MAHKPGTAWNASELEAELRVRFPDLDFPYLQREFTRTTDWITVFCAKHGFSKKQPHKLLTSGQGCVTCGKSRSVASRKYSTEQVVRLFKSVHGDRYDYSKVVVSAAMSNVTIICREHGEFEQIAQVHYLAKGGCPACAIFSKVQCQPVPYIEFLRRALAAHGTTYTYDESSYSGMAGDITAVCETHGTFQQRCFDHVYGAGCPPCNRTGFDITKPAVFYTYHIAVGEKEYLGFGISSRVALRDAQHQFAFSLAGATGRLRAVFKFKLGYHARELERLVKRSFVISNTGVPGFITEATHFTNCDLVDETAAGFCREWGLATEQFA